MLRVSDENDFGAEWTDMCRLSYQSLVVQHRLALEQTIARASVDEHALPQTVELNVHNLSDDPALGHRWQCFLQSAQLIVFVGERLVPHGPQLQLAVPGNQAGVLGPEGIAVAMLSWIHRQAAEGELTAISMGWAAMLRP